MSIHPYIISWAGKYITTCAIEDSLLNIGMNVKVLNGDKKNHKENWISIDESLRFGGQFLKILEMFNSSSTDKNDILLLITGDVKTENWEGITDSAIKCFNTYNCGIYTPYIDYSPWSSCCIPWYKTNDDAIRAIGCSDGIAFFIHKDILNNFYVNCSNAFKDNFFGWGIDLTLCALSWLSGRPVLQDRNYTVKHPKSRGYPITDAGIQMKQSLSKLDKDIKKYIRIQS